MLSTTKTWAWRALLLAAILGPTSAFAAGPLTSGIPTKSLDHQERTQVYIIDGYTDASGTNVTAGGGNCAICQSINVGGVPMRSLSLTVSSTSVAPLIYPARLHVGFRHATGQADAVGCATVSLTGVTPTGLTKTESWTGTAGTAFTATTTWAYERVLSFAATGCGASIATAATSSLRVAATQHYALPTPIRKVADILAMCQKDDDAAAEAWDCLTDVQLDSVSINTQSNTVNVEPTGYTATVGDRILIRYRSPNW